MTHPTINGYLVVSHPTSGTAYRGVDREPWDYIDAQYYAGKLPTEIHRLYESMRKAERGLWWPTTSSREVADQLLQFTRSNILNCELIAIYSRYLEQQGYQGCDTAGACYLGVDVISVGEWSLLSAIHHSAAIIPSDLDALLNEHGLLSSEIAAPEIDAFYRRLSAKEIVEALAPPESGIPVEPVHVYLISPCEQATAGSRR